MDETPKDGMPQGDMPQQTTGDDKPEETMPEGDGPEVGSPAGDGDKPAGGAW